MTGDPDSRTGDPDQRTGDPDQRTGDPDRDPRVDGGVSNRKASRESRPPRELPTFTRVLIGGAAFVIVIAGVRAAAAVTVPLMLSIFFCIICGPPVKKLERWMPFGVAVGLILFGMIALLIAIPVLVGTAVQQVINDLPDFQKDLRALEANSIEQLRGWGVNLPSDDIREAFDVGSVASVLGTFLNGLLRTFGDGVIVLLLVAFMLAETAWFSAKVAVIERGSGEASRRVAEVIASVHRYVGIKTLVSAGTGLTVGIGLMVLGIDHALVWGFLAFLLNYIPNVGSIIAGVPPVLLAMIQHGVGTALLVVLLYVAVNQIFGSVIEPRMQGRGLGLSPLIVFVSLLFWGWVFGPVGMLLSAPITMAIKVALEVFPETRWIAILLGGNPGDTAGVAGKLSGPSTAGSGNVPAGDVSPVGERHSG